jgi:hypothetical protein
MSLTNSRISYEDCYQVLDKALDAQDGVRVGFEDHEQAKFYQMRMNKARQLDRRFNEERYENLDDPRRQRSEYDGLTIRLRQASGVHWVYIEKRQVPQLIEEIKLEDEVDTRPIRQIASYRRF